MKNKMFMYLFFFAILFILFQYMNEKSIFEAQEKKINALTEQQVKNDSITETLYDQILDSSRFNLMNNDSAMTYLEKLGMEAEEAQNLVYNTIIDKNIEPNGNPLVPVAGIGGTMRINTMRFLNHRWVIAEFTDGNYWGEVLIEYFFDQENKLSLTPLESVLYAKQIVAQN